MTRFGRVLKYEFLNVIRSRWVFVNALLLTGLSFTFIQVGGDFAKALVTLSSITAVLVPLTSILFASFYWYYSEHFTQVLLTLPMRRSTLFLARLTALSASLGLSFMAGVTLPFLVGGHVSLGLCLVNATGLFLTIVFITLGTLVSIYVGDRMKGLGLALGVWLYFAMAHDALVLGVLLLLHDYPMDLPAGILGVLNPVGLTRVVLLIYHDAAMLLGHTGAMVRNMVTSGAGFGITAVLVVAWCLIPTWIAWNRFLKRDF